MKNLFLLPAFVFVCLNAFTQDLIIIGPTGATGPTGQIYVGTSNLLLQSNTGNQNHTILSNGDKASRVGIGTDVPEKKLHVKAFHDLIAEPGPGSGSIRIEDLFTQGGPTVIGTSTWDFSPNVGGLNIISVELPSKAVMSLRANGRVGIGTGTPQANLHISGLDDQFIDITSVNQNSNTRLMSTSNAETQLQYKEKFGLVEGIGAGTNRLTVLPGGNVGIATTTPDEKLHVDGTIRTDGTRTIVNGFNGGNNHWIRTAGPEPNSVFMAFNGMANGNANWVQIAPGGGGNIGLLVNNAGNVGIGTWTPTEKLEVAGVIRACEVKVEIFGGCDYVFDTDHQRMTFEERKKFYTTNKHLPKIDSALNMEENGLSIAEGYKGLLFNLEEFGLNQLDLYDEQEIMKETIKEQQETIEELKKRMGELEAKLVEQGK